MLVSSAATNDDDDDHSMSSDHETENPNDEYREDSDHEEQDMPTNENYAASEVEGNGYEDSDGALNPPTKMKRRTSLEKNQAPTVTKRSALPRKAKAIHDDHDSISDDEEATKPESPGILDDQEENDPESPGVETSKQLMVIDHPCYRLMLDLLRNSKSVVAPYPGFKVSDMPLGSDPYDPTQTVTPQNAVWHKPVCSR
jgi:hypothetical protein